VSDSTCTWIVADQGLCDEPATDYDNFQLCEGHQQALRVRKTTRLAALVRQSLQYHPLSSFPGYCYFAQLPDGMVKIGYSNTIELVDNRMRSLSKQYGAEVKLLATMPGGFVAEALMHDTFEVERLPGVGERFEPSPGLMKFIMELATKTQVTVPPGQDYFIINVADQGTVVAIDQLSQKLGVAKVLIDHCNKPPQAIPPWRAHPQPAWLRDKTPLPDDIITYEGRGKSAITDLACLIRYATSKNKTLSLTVATRELLALKNPDGTGRHNRYAVSRAWNALVDMCRLDQLDWDRRSGQAFWVECSGDPK